MLVVWKAAGCWSPQQERILAVMMMMKTSVVGVLQSLLEVVVLLLDLSEQLVLKLVEYLEL